MERTPNLKPRQKTYLNDQKNRKKQITKVRAKRPSLHKTGVVQDFWCGEEGHLLLYCCAKVARASSLLYNVIASPILCRVRTAFQTCHPLGQWSDCLGPITETFQIFPLSGGDFKAYYSCIAMRRICLRPAARGRNRHSQICIG